MNDTIEPIGARLKKAREWSGLSQLQVSGLLKIRRPSISEIESGSRKVSAEEVGHFCELYRVSSEWILTGATNDETNERIQVVARALADLKPEDLEKISQVVKALKTK